MLEGDDLVVQAAPQIVNVSGRKLAHRRGHRLQRARWRDSRPLRSKSGPGVSITCTLRDSKRTRAASRS